MLQYEKDYVCATFYNQAKMSIYNFLNNIYL